MFALNNSYSFFPDVIPRLLPGWHHLIDVRRLGIRTGNPATSKKASKDQDEFAVWSTTWSSCSVRRHASMTPFHFASEFRVSFAEKKSRFVSTMDSPGVSFARFFKYLRGKHIVRCGDEASGYDNHKRDWSHEFPLVDWRTARKILFKVKNGWRYEKWISWDVASCFRLQIVMRSLKNIAF